MTEQQIDNLKKILSSSQRVENSVELDKEILKAAKINAPDKQRYFDFLKLNYQPISFVSSAALSVLFTVAVFLSLSHILSNDKLLKDPDVSADYIVFEQQVDVLEQADPLASRTATDTIFQQPITQHARDQILAGMEPIAINVMLNGMEFAHEDERLLAEMTINQAMDDIRFMVMDGELNSARDRYERLRRSCSVCSLPKTLEALVLTEASTANRS